MSTQHTPGPWHRNIRADGKYPTVFAGRNQHVAVATQQKDAVETEANIDLIAAAPELLAEAHNFLAWFAQFVGKEAIREIAADCPQYRDLRAAIAKTEGK